MCSHVNRLPFVTDQLSVALDHDWLERSQLSDLAAVNPVIAHVINLVRFIELRKWGENVVQRLFFRGWSAHLRAYLQLR